MSNEYYWLHRDEIVAKKRIYNQIHSEEIRIKMREHRKMNPELIKTANKKCYLKHRAERLEIDKAYYLKNKAHILARRNKSPWLHHLYDARRRCNNENCKTYKWYGAKGIRCLMSPSHIKILWHRDGAELLKRPSLDRINHLGNYTYENCRFIECSENAKLAMLIRWGKS